MSIAEQAQQLSALAGQVPVQMSQEIKDTLGSLQGQIAGILGDTSGAQELQGLIGAISNQLDQVSAGLEHLRQSIETTATYHQR